MTEKELAKQLQREGFGQTYVWEDGPNIYYPGHTYANETTHVILRGEMTLIIGGETRTYRTGERCDVPAGTLHAARMGPVGCRYLIGER